MQHTKRIIYSIFVFSIFLTAVEVFADDAKEKTPPAKEEKKIEAKKAPHLSARGKRMVEVCKLNEEQTEKLAQALETNKQNLKAFKNAKAEGTDKTNAEMMRDIRKQMTEAWHKKDKETYKTLKAQVAPLEEQKFHLREENKKRIESILTDQQKYDWAGYMAGEMSCRQLKRTGVKVTDDQRKQIVKMCQKCGQDFYLAKAPKERRKLYKKIHEQIDATILTPEQREAISKKAAEKSAKKAEKKKAKDKLDKSDGPDKTDHDENDEADDEAEE